MRPILLTAALLLTLLPAQALGEDVVDYQSATVGTVIPVPAKDADVTVFTYRPKDRAIARMARSDNALADYLQKLVDKKEYNTAAYVARHAPEERSPFVRQWIMDRIDSLTPPFYYVMAAKLDKQNTEAAFQWYLRGYLASRTDAALCRDKSARQGVVYLNNILGPELQAKIHSFANAPDIHVIQQKAVDYVRTHLTSASPMWLCSHGISTMTGEALGHDATQNRSEQLDILAEKFLKQ